MKRFTITYYTGEEYDRPTLKKSHVSILEVVRWCQKNYLPLEVIKITEIHQKGNSTPRVVGSCSLADAYEGQMQSLAM